MRAADPQKEEGGVTAQPRAVSEALTPSCEREEAPHLPSPNRKNGGSGATGGAAWTWGPRERGYNFCLFQNAIYFEFCSMLSRLASFM